MARPREFDPETAVAAAVPVFRRLGYRATSIRDLGDHLELSLSSLYRAFEDKHGLFLRAIDHYRETESTQGGRIFRGAQPTIDALMTGLIEMILVDSGTDDAAGCFVVNTAAELGRTDPDVTERTEAAFALTRSGLQELLGRIQQAGRLHEGIDLDAVTDTLFTLILGWQLRVRAGHPRGEIEASIRNSVELIMPPTPRMLLP